MRTSNGEGGASSDKTEQWSRVVGEIISLIEQRRYAPGERVPSERDLAERLSVGRGVVREAMTTLESMRYVERRPGSGVFLCRVSDAISLETLVLFAGLGLPIDPKVNAECIEVRRMIEVQAIQLACERRTAEDIDRLRRTLLRFEDSAAFTDAPQYDYDFHMDIFRATHNEILIRLVTPFYMISRTRREVFFADRARRKVSHAQHLSMVRAIEDENAQRAGKLMSAHIGRVERYFG